MRLLPSKIKSLSSVILNDLIYGVAITTLGLPPNYGNFAYISPKDLVTANRPGKTLQGPNK